MKTQICISGMSVLSGMGETAAVLFESGASGKKITPYIDVHAYETTIAPFDTGPYELYRVQKILLAVYAKALSNAGLKNIPGNAGIFLGNTYGIEEFKAEFFRVYKKSGPAATSPVLFPFTTANALAAWLAIQVSAQGPQLSFVSGSTACADAIIAAMDSLQAGECEIAFVGGVNLLCPDFIDDFYASGFQQETAGMLVLETKQRMEKTGRKPLAVINDWQQHVFNEKQIEKSTAGIEEEALSCFKTASSEIIHWGNSLDKNIFSCEKNNLVVTKKDRTILILNKVTGNLFDPAAIVAVALGVDFLNGQGSMNPFVSLTDGIACTVIDSTGVRVRFDVCAR